MKNLPLFTIVLFAFGTLASDLSDSDSFQLREQVAGQVSGNPDGDNLWQSNQPIDSLKLSSNLKDESVLESIQSNLHYHSYVASITIASLFFPVLAHVLDISAFWPFPDRWLTPYISRKSINLFSGALSGANVINMLARFSWRPQKSWPSEFITGCSASHNGLIFIGLSDSDWNGALNIQLTHFLEQIGTDYAIYFKKLSSKQDLKDALMNAHRVCNLPVKGFIVAGHGTQNSIGIGADTLWSSIDDLKFLELGKYLDVQASIVLQSCETGSEDQYKDNIAAKFAQVAPGRKVYAPKSFSSTWALDLTIGKEHIKASFYSVWLGYFLGRELSSRYLSAETACYVYSQDTGLDRCLEQEK